MEKMSRWIENDSEHLPGTLVAIILNTILPSEEPDSEENIEIEAELSKDAEIEGLPVTVKNSDLSHSAKSLDGKSDAHSPGTNGVSNGYPMHAPGGAGSPPPNIAVFQAHQVCFHACLIGFVAKLCVPCNFRCVVR